MPLGTSLGLSLGRSPGEPLRECTSLTVDAGDTQHCGRVWKLQWPTMVAPLAKDMHSDYLVLQVVGPPALEAGMPLEK